MKSWNKNFTVDVEIKTLNPLYHLTSILTALRALRSTSHYETNQKQYSFIAIPETCSDVAKQ